MFDLTASTLLSLATLLGLGAGVVLQRWQLGRLHARVTGLEQRTVAAEQAAGALATRLAGLGEALAAAAAEGAVARARQSELDTRVEALESRSTGEQPYGDAIRLVREGAREGRLVDELGLSPIEASLIVRLHGGCARH
jgi:BMFP domain-containing protein YqiC